MTSKARAKNWHISSLDGLKPSELEKIAYGLSEIQAEVALHDWSKHARPEQIAPEGNWAQWLFLAGRGAGKTRAGSEWVRSMVRAGFKRGAMIAPTASDARDVMVEGSSGILATSWKFDEDIQGKALGVPVYEPTKRRVHWDNGAMVTTFSAEEPDRLRGPQHEFLWCDELAAWQNASDAWDMAMLGLGSLTKISRARRLVSQCMNRQNGEYTGTMARWLQRSVPRSLIGYAVLSTSFYGAMS